MKRLIFFTIGIILVATLMFGGCGEPEPTPTATPPVSSVTPSSSPSATTVGPVKGGVLRCVSGSLPKVLGYTPEFSPTETIYTLPVLERLCEWDNKGVLHPILAESWEGDPQALTITWHLRKGVKFHDGTDWNAEALRWNFQLLLDSKRLTDGKYVESLEVIDEYTLKMNLSEFHWLLFESYGFHQHISPTAFEGAGATDEERIQWARQNAVGTGAFTISHFQRDTILKYVKSDSYWREGMPYLDGIEVSCIPDPMIAAAKMEAGEADMWLAASSVQNILDLQEKGFKINWEFGMFMALLPNSNDPDSILANKKVREAIEYAINRPAIAELLGQGLYEPLTQLSSKNSPSYIEGYDPRPYNPEKARQLLAEAGVPEGFKVKVLCTDSARDAIAALQSFLGEVGIIVEPDVADFGRYFGAIFGTGWEDLALAGSGIHPDGKELYIHFGPEPVTYITGNIYKSPEFLAYCAAGLDTKYMSPAEAMPKIKDAIRQAGEDAMLCPLWRTCNTGILQPYVHSDYFTLHSIIWTSYDDWMENH